MPEDSTELTEEEQMAVRILVAASPQTYGKGVAEQLILSAREDEGGQDE